VRDRSNSASDHESTAPAIDTNTARSMKLIDLAILIGSSVPTA
jgi:hypothetical protein